VGWVRTCTAGEVPNGVLLYRRSAPSWWMNPKVHRKSRELPCGVPSDPNCPFCAIVAGTASAEVVLRDDVAVAFLDRTPLFRGHVLVVPIDHVVTLPELAAVGPFFERVQRVAAVVPGALGAQGTFVANNNVVSQSVAHLHVHVVPRTKGDGLRGFFWPRTKYRAGEAETVAATLRAALERTG
jgi:histidine triad (HIT) family protein